MTPRTATLLILLGGAMTAIGSLLPWTIARSGLATAERAGTDGDGVFTLGIGIVIVVLAIIGWERPLPRVGRMGVIMLSAAAFGIAALVYGSVSDFIAQGSDIEASIGMGLYITAAGALIALIGGARLVPASASMH